MTRRVPRGSACGHRAEAGRELWMLSGQLAFKQEVICKPARLSKKAPQEGASRQGAAPSEGAQAVGTLQEQRLLT